MEEQNKASKHLENIRSDEVQEILSHVPSWMIRWGISLVFGLLLLLVILSAVIKYPDVVSGRVNFTTEVPPIKLISKNSGQLNRINLKHGEQVKKGDFIAEIENPLTEDGVHFLTHLIEQTKVHLETKDLSGLRALELKNADLLLGNVQSDYNQFKSALRDYLKMKSDHYAQKKIQNIEKQILAYSELAQINKRQYELKKKEFQNTEERYTSNYKLYQEEVISKAEIFREEAQLIQGKQQLEEMNKVFVQNKITLTDYEKQLNELRYSEQEKERKLEEKLESSIENMLNLIGSWSQNYVFIAPFDGELSFMSKLVEGQFVDAGKPLFAVIPENNEYVASINIPAQGFGKVKIGQHVNIKLDNYPFHEFGMLSGEISEIHPIPDQGKDGKEPLYLATVSFSGKLETSYHKQIDFKPEMSGSAEVVTEDLRLLDRIFNQFRKLFDR